MPERLCGRCRAWCKFKRQANGEARKVKRGKISAEQAAANIAAYRITARQVYICPQINSVDPDYPGKSSL